MSDKTKTLHLLFLLFRILIGGFFIYTGYSKVFFISGFADEIYYYRLFPEFIIGISAVFMPFFEIIIGIFLILGIWFKATLSLLFLSLLSFIIMISSALVRGLDISCGCFGYGKGNLETTLILDIVILGIIFFMLFYRDHKYILDNKIRNS